MDVWGSNTLTVSMLSQLATSRLLEKMTSGNKKPLRREARTKGMGYNVQHITSHTTPVDAYLCSAPASSAEGLSPVITEAAFGQHPPLLYSPISKFPSHCHTVSP